MTFFTFFVVFDVLITISILVLILGIENPKRVWAASPQRRG
jgi:hypothetical protein